MEQLLLELGFKPKEAKIYLALLEIGSGTISQVAKRAGINRTTAYDIVYDLEKEGLVNAVAGTKKQTWNATPAENLPLYFEQKSQQQKDRAARAQEILPQLRMAESRRSSKPKIELFEGKAKMKQLYENTLLSQEPIRSFSSTEYLESFDPTYLHSYYKERAKKGVAIKAIINDIPSAHEYRRLDPELLREVRIVPKALMDITPEVYVYDEKVVFFSLEERYAVQIESIDIATALKKLFDLAWDKAGEYNKKIPEATLDKKPKKS